MNLNTVTAFRRPASADEITEWRNGYAWLAGGTWLFSEPQPATDTLIDLDQLRLAGAWTLARRARYRRDLPHRRALSLRGAQGMDCRPADPRVLRRAAGFVQNLERGDGRRQHLHVSAGRAR